MQVALVDPEANPGGVCLYRGCIPSKALLHVAKLMSEAQHATTWGMTYGEPKIDLDKLRAFKDQVVNKMTSGLGQIAKHAQGHATSRAARRSSTRRRSASSSRRGGTETLTFEHAIIATGSRPSTVPGLSIDSPRVMDSTGALDLPGHSEVAARRRRRLHRPRAGIGVRRARHEGHGRRDDAGPAARRRSRSRHVPRAAGSRRRCTRCCSTRASST